MGQNGKNVPIVFSASGSLDMNISNGLTPEDVMQILGNDYGLRIDKSITPFAVVHDKLLNKFETVELKDEFPKNLDPERHMVRIVIPFGEGIRDE